MKDELRWNKIFGGILGAVLLMLVVRIGAETLFARPALKTPGYAIAVASGPESGGAAEVADTPPDWGTELSKADVAAGEAVSQKCASCHNFANGGPNQTGPNQTGKSRPKPNPSPRLHRRLLSLPRLPPHAPPRSNAWIAY